MGGCRLSNKIMSPAGQAFSFARTHLVSTTAALPLPSGLASRRSRSVREAASRTDSSSISGALRRDCRCSSDFCDLVGVRGCVDGWMFVWCTTTTTLPHLQPPLLFCPSFLPAPSRRAAGSAAPPPTCRSSPWRTRGRDASTARRTWPETPTRGPPVMCVRLSLNRGGRVNGGNQGVFFFTRIEQMDAYLLSESVLDAQEHVGDLPRRALQLQGLGLLYVFSIFNLARFLPSCSKRGSGSTDGRDAPGAPRRPTVWLSGPAACARWTPAGPRGSRAPVYIGSTRG